MTIKTVPLYYNHHIYHHCRLHHGPLSVNDGNIWGVIASNPPRQEIGTRDGGSLKKLPTFVRKGNCEYALPFFRRSFLVDKFATHRGKVIVSLKIGKVQPQKNENASERRWSVLPDKKA